LRVEVRFIQIDKPIAEKRVVSTIAGTVASALVGRLEPIGDEIHAARSAASRYLGSSNACDARATPKSSAHSTRSNFLVTVRTHPFFPNREQLGAFLVKSRRFGQGHVQYVQTCSSFPPQ